MHEASSEKRALIFDIARYRNEDGPGIRTIVFFKGCPLRCVWCSNPLGGSGGPELVVNQTRCTQCGTCVETCPRDVNRLESGVLQVDFECCTACGSCVLACSADARTISGRQFTVREVFAEIEKDAAFYRRDGGGVTLSGGEVLMQSEFAAELLKLCKENFVSTAIETSGHAAWEAFEAVARYSDLVFVDLKMMDSARHRQYTGVGNEQVLANIARLCEYASARGRPRTIVRRLIVEGMTDDDETTVEAARFVNDLPTHPEVNLLPFHNLAESKYEMIGREYGLRGKKMGGVADSRMQHVFDLTVRHAPACRVSIGGANIALR